MTISGWGNFPRVEGGPLLRARGAEQIRAAVAGHDGLIARGNGRAYGDAAIGRHATLSVLPSDRVLAFDDATGLLTCEAGLLLADLLALVLPKGWFVPVTPGTKFVTVGGMIAADVHGKNHRGAGSFCRHVDNLVLALADGRLARCSPAENADLFAATCGGMGLTGVIVSATFRLMPIETAYIRQETRRAPDIEAAMAMFEEAGPATYSVAWVDCLARGARLGRSLFHLGEHASAGEVGGAHPLAARLRRSRRLPVDPSGLALNRWSVGLFNALYYARGRPGTTIVDYDRFFYPLDAVQNWNRLYGRRGLIQYQCVLPKGASASGLRLLLDRIARSGRPSYLAVLKLFGRQEGLLSFPMEGYSLALDFPADAATLSLLVELDAIVADHGGRLYLAKDSRAGVAMMRRGYPRLDEFLALRRAVDPGGRFSSLQSERLGL